MGPCGSGALWGQTYLLFSQQKILDRSAPRLHASAQKEIINKSDHAGPGRYRAEMIEDESYYWTVSRYVHLNPVRAGLVRRPEQWEWSSYPGYRDARRARAWVAHDELLAAWRGDKGGRDARGAYVRLVDEGLDDPPRSPFREAFGGWVLGSERFVARLRSLAGPILSNPPAAEARQVAGLDPKRIFAAVADFYGLEGGSLSRRHDPHLARAVAAWLCPRHTEASLRELAEWLGLSRADSVPNLTRRLEARLKTSSELTDDLTVIMKRANEPAAGTHPADLIRRDGPRQSARPKTKNKAEDTGH